MLGFKNKNLSLLNAESDIQGDCPSKQSVLPLIFQMRMSSPEKVSFTQGHRDKQGKAKTRSQAFGPQVKSSLYFPV